MVSVTRGCDTAGGRLCRDDTWCRVPADVVPWSRVRAEADSAAGWATAGTREMSLMNTARTTSTAVVATVSSHNIRR